MVILIFSNLLLLDFEQNDSFLHQIGNNKSVNRKLNYAHNIVPNMANNAFGNNILNSSSIVPHNKMEGIKAVSFLTKEMVVVEKFSILYLQYYYVYSQSRKQS